MRASEPCVAKASPCGGVTIGTGDLLVLGDVWGILAFSETVGVGASGILDSFSAPQPTAPIKRSAERAARGENEVFMRNLQ
jgi:hypothetical protein